jgi:hypothetical protein
MSVAVADSLKIKEYGDHYANRNQDWICFEEDTKLCIAQMAMLLKKEITVSEKEIDSCIRSLTRWHFDYLNSLDLDNYGDIGQLIGLMLKKMKPELERISNQRKIREKIVQMKNKKDPDLIVGSRDVLNYLDLKHDLVTVTRRAEWTSEEQLIDDIKHAMDRDLIFYHESISSLFSQGQVTLVWTADDGMYLVRQHKPDREVDLLSLCVKVASFYL